MFEAETLKRLQGNEEGVFFFFVFVKTGGIQFYTVENLARNVPDRGHSGSDPPPRRRGKKRGASANQKRPNGRKCRD